MEKFFTLFAVSAILSLFVTLAPAYNELNTKGVAGYGLPFAHTTVFGGCCPIYENNHTVCGQIKLTKNGQTICTTPVEEPEFNPLFFFADIGIAFITGILISPAVHKFADGFFEKNKKKKWAKN